MKKYPALVALALTFATSAVAEVTGGSYSAKTFWTEVVHEEDCIRTSTYVVLTFDTTKKNSSVPPSVLVSQYVDDTCTGEFLRYAYGILNNPMTKHGTDVSVVDTVQIEGTINDIIYKVDVPIELAWTGFSNEQRWWSNSGYEGACVVSTSTYDQTSWVAEISGWVDGLPVDSAPAGKTVYSSKWKEWGKQKGC